MRTGRPQNNTMPLHFGGADNMDGNLTLLCCTAAWPLAFSINGKMSAGLFRGPQRQIMDKIAA